MPDREKVIKALEHHKGNCVCNGCPYAGDNDTPQGNCPVYDDALALLREQEPVKPEFDSLDGNVGRWRCGNCHISIGAVRAPYCWHCGRAVKWDA